MHDQVPNYEIDEEDEGEVITDQDILQLDLHGFLKQNSEGCALLVIKNRNEQLTNTSRSRLSRLIIKRELEAALANVDHDELLMSEFIITKRKFLIYTKSIVKIFTSERRCTYYSVYSNVNGIKIPAKGKLYDNYIYTKSKLREDGVLVNTKTALIEKPAPTISTSDETQNDPKIVEELESLKNRIESFDILKTYWTNTFKKRQALLHTDRLSVHDYFHLFPCLSNDDYAIDLLSKDFEQLFPNKKDNLIKNWPNLKIKLINLLEKRNNIKDVDDLSLQKLIKVVNSASQDAIILHLLPYLTGHPYVHIPEEQQVVKIGAKRKRKATKRRATALQNRESFFMVSATVGNIEEDIRSRKEKLLELGLPLQPLPIFIGTLSNIVDAYVLVDDIKYRTKNPIEAIDLTFKIFHAVDCEYPAPSVYSWILVKKFGYDIDITETDLSLGMKSLLGDLNN